MPPENDTSPRTVSPRKWALVTATSLATIGSPAVTTLLTASTAWAETGAAAAEAGEAGEAGVILAEGPTEFLTRLGYFEGTYRIIVTLYLSGNRDLAREHMELSHHAWYEDIEEYLEEYGAAGFEAEHQAFMDAVASDGSDEDVQSALDTVLTALNAGGMASQASLFDQLMSIKDLVTLATAEFEGGVSEGTVEADIEFRDSWGFYETARQRALAMSASADEAAAKAGAQVLEQMQGLEEYYPGLTATEAPENASGLAVAAGWIEIIALRNK
ncbi:MAG: hypothetical protein R3256_07390 [Thalassovita sp.]|nr:hypothetical protein [Thalassovita sp.]